MGLETARDQGGSARRRGSKCPCRSCCRRFPFRAILICTALVLFFSPVSTLRGDVTPVGQLPTVMVGLTPSVHALPILLLNDMAEWKDFGIQVQIKVFPDGAHLLEGAIGNTWEVAVMDPFFAFRGGNDGDVAIVGIAGDLIPELALLVRKGANPLQARWEDSLGDRRIAVAAPSAEHFYLTRWLEQRGVRMPQAAGIVQDNADVLRILAEGHAEMGLLREPYAQILLNRGWDRSGEFPKENAFLPVCLVASVSYADTRKTLVLRWLEGYSRGIRIIRKDPAKAAARLRQFYRETLKEDISEALLDHHIREAFSFAMQERERLSHEDLEKGGPLTELAEQMTAYLVREKLVRDPQEPSDYLLAQLGNQLSILRSEAVAKLKETAAAIRGVEQVGASVGPFRKTWEEARIQIDDGRGCLAVIGILSDLQRSAEQSRAETLRLAEFRRIEAGFALFLLLYYGGYFFCWKRRRTA